MLGEGLVGVFTELKGATKPLEPQIAQNQKGQTLIRIWSLSKFGGRPKWSAISPSTPKCCGTMINGFMAKGVPQTPTCWLWLLNLVPWNDKHVWLQKEIQYFHYPSFKHHPKPSNLRDPMVVHGSTLPLYTWLNGHPTWAFFSSQGTRVPWGLPSRPLEDMDEDHPVPWVRIQPQMAWIHQDIWMIFMPNHEPSVGFNT